jgi:hypothetical protein
MGKNSNIDKQERIIKIEYSDTTKLYTLHLMGDDNFTKNMMKRNMEIKAMDFFNEIYKDDRADRFTILFFMPIVDQYGQSSIGKVMQIEFNKEIANKINWENKSLINLSEIAEEYWSHPAINK